MRFVIGGIRTIFALLGILAMAAGLLWAGQGLGWIMWPASSFMLQQPVWALYGGALALGGLVVFWLAIRLGRRRRR